jgi:hypothetical protein
MLSSDVGRLARVVCGVVSLPRVSAAGERLALGCWGGLLPPGPGGLIAPVEVHHREVPHRAGHDRRGATGRVGLAQVGA